MSDGQAAERAPASAAGASVASLALSAPLPARWSVAQRLKNGAIYAVVRLMLLVLHGMPFALTRALLVLLAHLAWLVARSDRRRAEAQLAAAFPDKSAAERRALAHAMFVHLGESLAESVHVERFVEGPHAVRIPDEARRVIDEVVAEGRGAVAVTGHIGNWELMAQVMAHAGVEVATIAKALYDPRLTRLMHRERTRYGLEVIWRGDAAVGKEMAAAFRANRFLALLIDQDTRVRGAFVPFFGKPAHTPTAAAALALRHGAPVVVGWAHRVNGRHLVHLERVPVPTSGDHDADVVALTADLTQRLEGAIRQHPEQWVWMHRRWKKQPPGTEAQKA